MGSMPRRARHLIPTDLPHRREVMAACAVLIVVAHLLVAQLTLGLAVAFTVIGSASRWRLWWLIGPAAAGLAWALVVGPAQAAAGFAAGSAHVLDYLGQGQLAQRLGHPLAAFAGAGELAARQLPIALISGAAEAAADRLARLAAHRRTGGPAASARRGRGDPGRPGRVADPVRGRCHQGGLRARGRPGHRRRRGPALAGDRGRCPGGRHGGTGGDGHQPAGGARRAPPPQAADRHRPERRRRHRRGVERGLHGHRHAAADGGGRRSRAGGAGAFGRAASCRLAGSGGTGLRRHRGARPEPAPDRRGRRRARLDPRL